jgi:hypothetical protein
MTDRSRSELLLLGTIAVWAYNDNRPIGERVEIGETLTDYTLVQKETHRGTGADRGLWPPAGQGSAWHHGRGDGPCQCSGDPHYRLGVGTGNAPRFPRTRRTFPPRPVPPAIRKASARPGGCEAPAMGGTGAGRGLWPPAGQGSAWRCGRGDGPCQCSGESAFAPPAAGTRCNQDRSNPRHGGPAPAGQGWHRSLSCPWGAFFGELQPKDPQQSASCVTPPALRPFSDRR